MDRCPECRTAKPAPERPRFTGDLAADVLSTLRWAARLLARVPMRLVVDALAEERAYSREEVDGALLALNAAGRVRVAGECVEDVRS